jgi:protein TonB
MSSARAWVAAAVMLAAAAAPMRAGEPLRAPRAEGVDAVPAPPSARLRLEQIRALVQAALVYPQAARERGIQGVARIQFRIDPAGHAADVVTVESSGSHLLDSAAQQAARDARALPHLYGWVRIPVRFELAGR